MADDTIDFKIFRETFESLFHDPAGQFTQFSYYEDEKYKGRNLWINMEGHEAGLNQSYCIEIGIVKTGTLRVRLTAKGGTVFAEALSSASNEILEMTSLRIYSPVVDPTKSASEKPRFAILLSCDLPQASNDDGFKYDTTNTAILAAKMAEDICRYVVPVFIRHIGKKN